MPVLSYMDDIFKLSHCYVTRDYSNIKVDVINSREELDYAYEENGELWGYKIYPNVPLKKLYGFDVWVVRFFFSGVDTLHNKQQETIMDTLFTSLKDQMDSVPGYYNIRLPSHIVDAIKGFNKHITSTMFCGGTVEQIISQKKIVIECKEGITTFFASKDYIDQHKKVLLDMTFASFETYQGQYHISQTTASKAGMIYENWINGSFKQFQENTVLVVEYQGEPIGFCTIGEDEFAVEGQLSAVSSKHRKLGGYKTMISTLINYAADNQKSFIASTQFDNFIVQGTWNSLGMRPYFSFYNFHYDNRKKG
ncbi:MAG TPA: GNAT family N-acetyltransferase [Sedimentibacter sp.]|nr:GNAT family N-acetyltransferase [Sedimentibacter sp.]